jgi:hypothetical protein
MSERAGGASWMRRAPLVVLSPWAMLTLVVWWLWRLAIVQSLPGYQAPEHALDTLLGFGQDLLLLYALFGLQRWWLGRRIVAGQQNPAAGQRVAFELGFVVLLDSALLRGLDAIHAHLGASHISVGFWQALGQHLADWMLGMHTLLILLALTAWLGRWALRRDLSHYRLQLSRLPDAKRSVWNQRILWLGLGSLATGAWLCWRAGVAAVSIGTLPEAGAIYSLLQAFGMAG